MPRMKPFVAKVQQFIRAENGTVMIEALMVMPMLFWCIVAMYGYWDVFRSYNVFQKATHTVSNVLSRTQKMSALSEDDMRGYYRLMNYLVQTEGEVSIRFTEYTFDEDNDEYVRNWSCPMGDYTALDTVDLNMMRGKLPILQDGDVHVMLEAKYFYNPPFSFSFLYMETGGLSSQEFTETVIDRPRDGDFDLPPDQCPTIL